MRELGKRSPLVALLLLVGLLSSVGVYQSKVSRLQMELKAQKTGLETAKLELYQQTVSALVSSSGAGRSSCTTVCQTSHKSSRR